jgi:2-polyprenyl-3-methyl-5-hydroxy-6-metoxy-1,4-benzoquinol methylase
MTFPSSEEFDKIREQYNYGPYPRIPLDKSPRESYETLYCHNFITAYYLRHRRVPETSGKLILDAGCGSGYKSLILAEANPGAKIVGIDLSEKSVELARQRLEYHGFSQVEFHAISIEELPKLGLEFDYINCDEVLYLLPDPVAGLETMKSVLKPDGLIRANLHSFYQRANYYRSQTLFHFMGLLDNGPREFAEEAVIETMQSLKDFVKLKAETWQGGFRDPNPENVRELINVNQLIVGDKGFTIPDMFAMLQASDLEFVSMVNWRHWDVTDLFQDPDNLPALWDLGLATASVEDRLRLYELLHPIHRLLDFWCAHPGEAGIPIDDWSDADWQKAIVHLHPQLRTDRMKQELIRCLQTAQAFDISRDVLGPTQAPVLIDPSAAACLLPLWEGAQPIQAIAHRYQQVRPVDSVSLEPLTEDQAFAAVRDLLNRMDAFLYVLVEKSMG